MNIFCLNDTQESILILSQILTVRKSPVCNLEIFFHGRQDPLIFHFTSQKDLENDYKILIRDMYQA